MIDEGEKGRRWERSRKRLKCLECFGYSQSKKKTGFAKVRLASMSRAQREKRKKDSS